VRGPYIEPSTYAAYTDGAYLEARGEWRAAEEAYRRALEQDPDSPSIWTRLGVILCRDDLQSALEAFRRANEHSGHGPAWAARARCLYEHRRSPDALASAKAAIGFDPTDADANLLIAEIYREQARPASSSAWLFAWLLLDPHSLSHWKALAAQADALADRSLSLLLRSELEQRVDQGSEIGAAALSALQPPKLSPGLHKALEEAVARGDLARARTSAHAAGISELDLATLALEMGSTSLAASQAQLLLGADPQNGDAWIVALAAAALASDEEGFARLLTTAAGTRPPRAALAEHMTSLLSWWIGEAAASEWAEAYRSQAASGR
jgi:tetratricopeptide (TPR) repeat protein